MTNIAISLIILIAIAALAVMIVIIAYNRRLDRITKGEERDTHNRIPEPRTALDAAYKIILMVLAVVIFVGVSTISGMVISMQSNINDLNSSKLDLYRELYDIKDQIKESNSKIASYEYVMKDPDIDNNLAKLELKVALKEYGSDTKVTFLIDDKSYELNGTGNGKYSTELTVPLFYDYFEADVAISEEGRTLNETVEGPGTVFWDYLPMPGMSCTFNSDVKFGKLNYSGFFRYDMANTDVIDSVKLTYVSDGKDLKTLDVTNEVKNNSEITLESGLDVKHDLSIRTRIETTYGYVVETQQTVIFEARPDIATEEYERILDKNGNIIWENEKY